MTGSVPLQIAVKRVAAVPDSEAKRLTFGSVNAIMPVTGAASVLTGLCICQGKMIVF